MQQKAPLWTSHEYRTLMRQYILRNSHDVPMRHGAWRMAANPAFPHEDNWDVPRSVIMPSGDTTTWESPIITRYIVDSGTPNELSVIVQRQPHTDGVMCGIHAFNTMMQRNITSPSMYAHALAIMRPEEYANVHDRLPQMDPEILSYMAMNVGVFFMQLRIQPNKETERVLTDPDVEGFFARTGSLLMLKASGVGDSASGHYVCLVHHRRTDDRMWMCLDGYKHAPTSVVETFIHERQGDFYRMIKKIHPHEQGILLVPLYPALLMGKDGVPWPYASHPQNQGDRPSMSLNSMHQRLLKACAYKMDVSPGYIDSGFMDLSRFVSLMKGVVPPEVFVSELSCLLHDIPNLVEYASKKTIAFLTNTSNNTTIGEVIKEMSACKVGTPTWGMGYLLREMIPCMHDWLRARAAVIQTVFMEHDPTTLMHGVWLYLCTAFCSQDDRDGLTLHACISSLRLLVQLFAPPNVVAREKAFFASNHFVGCRDMQGVRTMMCSDPTVEHIHGSALSELFDRRTYELVVSMVNDMAAEELPRRARTTWKDKNGADLTNVALYYMTGLFNDVSAALMDEGEMDSLGTGVLFDLSDIYGDASLYGRSMHMAMEHVRNQDKERPDGHAKMDVRLVEDPMPFEDAIRVASHRNIV